MMICSNKKNLLYVAFILLLLYACHPKPSPYAYKGENNPVLVAQVKDTIGFWIRNFARYPESYVPETWGDYNNVYSGTRYVDATDIIGRMVAGLHPDSITREVKPLRLYRIFHTYRLLNKDSIEKRYTDLFVLQYDMHVQSVDTPFSDVGWYNLYSDHINEWLNDNGRPLDPTDTVDVLTPYRKALFYLCWELDTVRDRWNYPGERKPDKVIGSIDSLYQAYFHQPYYKSGIR